MGSNVKISRNLDPISDIVTLEFTTELMILSIFVWLSGSGADIRFFGTPCMGAKLLGVPDCSLAIHDPIA
mgnify:CR=1 FL=1